MEGSLYLPRAATSDSSKGLLLVTSLAECQHICLKVA